MKHWRWLSMTFAVAACSSAAAPKIPCSNDIDCNGEVEARICSATTNVCEQGQARATLIGSGDGSPASVTLTIVSDPGRALTPTRLAFNPKRPEELWVVNAKDNSITLIAQPGAAPQRKKDPAAGHFMDKPMAIAFADDDSWATCGDNDNSRNGNPGFMGPATFSSDTTVFATQNSSTGLGSHLDMLHASPFCMGITHERDHAFWIFDGENGALVRYDFKEYHPPGEEDHSDGDIAFYALGQVSRSPGIPSDLAYGAEDKQLYAADTGNGRIVKLDTQSGTRGQDRSSFEPSIPYEMDGATLVDFVPPGTMTAPSGLALKDGILYATDNATSKFYAFDMTGRVVRSLDTGLEAGSLGGITIGPDGKMYFVDMKSSRLYRIDTI